MNHILGPIALDHLHDAPSAPTGRRPSRASNAAPGWPPAQNVLDLVVAIDRWFDLPLQSRRVLKANVRTAGLVAARAKARADGRYEFIPRDDSVLCKIPADPEFLNKHLWAYPAAICDTKEACRNLSISGLRGVMRRVGLLDPQSISTSLPSDCPWRQLLDRVEDTYAQTALSTFATWCHGKDIQPPAVSQTSLESFERWLWTRTLHKEIPRLIYNVAKAWRRAAVIIQYPTAAPLSAPRRSKAYVRLLNTYPQSLQNEVQQFLSWFRGDTRKGLFQGDGRGRRRNPRLPTAQIRHYCISQALHALIETGPWTVETVRLRDLVEPEAFEAILPFYWERAVLRKTGRPSAEIANLDLQTGVTAQTASIAATLMFLGRRYFKLDEEKLAPLRDRAADAFPEQTGQLARKNLERLRQFDDPVTRAKLLHLPHRIRELIEAGHYRPLEAARMARVAAAIELLLHIPIRNSNLCRLRLGEHLRYDASPSGYIRRLVLQRHETKNRYEGEWLVGSDLAATLEWYIRDHRPLLDPDGGDYLFPAGFGKPGPISTAAMYQSIVRTVADFVGAELNPHLFRCICAYLILEQSPDALEDVRVMLGDKSMIIILKHYAASQPRHAVERLIQLLRKLRSESAHLVGALDDPTGAKR